MDYFGNLNESKQDVNILDAEEKEVSEIFSTELEEPPCIKEDLQFERDDDNVVLVKCEPKLESDENEDSDSDLELSKVKEKIKSRKRKKVNSDEKSDGEEEYQYETFILKTYTSATIKEEHNEEDIKSIFKENNIEFEKQKFYQQIVEQIVNDSDQVKLKVLQKLYINQLHQISNSEIFTCTSCPYRTISMTNMKCHLLIIHNKQMIHKMFRCKTCNFEHDHRIAMQKHFQIHKNYQPDGIIHKCEECSYIGPSKRALKSHIKKQHTEEKTPLCDLCRYKAKDAAELKKHMGTHRVAGSHRYKCFKCDHEVANKMKMARHLLKVHQIDNERIQKLQNIKCDVCDYRTDSVHRLKQHQLIHKNPEEITYFYCDKCSFKCKLKHGLKKHILVMHTDKSERVYSQMCDKCSYKCERPSMLKLHMLSHMDKSEINESELHKCPHCPFLGKTKGNLKSHMYSHSDETYKCDLCGFETKRQRNYRDHKKLHMKSSEVKIYSCEFCPYQTKFKPCLVNHMKQGDHTGKNLKHIPHKFRIENADNPEFDPTAVRFGPPKKYPKYPKKNKEESKNGEKGVLQSGAIAVPNPWINQNAAGESSAAGDVFLNFMGATRFRY